jgi:hypothetical protein
MTTELCEWCVADSGRTHAHRECCRVRQLAKMPPAQRAQAFDGLLVQLGSAGLAAFKDRVRAEYARLRTLARDRARKQLGLTG